jgi:hypothetical protein
MVQDNRFNSPVEVLSDLRAPEQLLFFKNEKPQRNQVYLAKFFEPLLLAFYKLEIV